MERRPNSPLDNEFPSALVGQNQCHLKCFIVSPSGFNTKKAWLKEPIVLPLIGG